MSRPPTRACSTASCSPRRMTSCTLSSSLTHPTARRSSRSRARSLAGDSSCVGQTFCSEDHEPDARDRCACRAGCRARSGRWSGCGCPTDLPSGLSEPTGTAQPANTTPAATAVCAALRLASLRAYLKTPRGAMQILPLVLFSSSIKVIADEAIAFQPTSFLQRLQRAPPPPSTPRPHPTVSSRACSVKRGKV